MKNIESIDFLGKKVLVRVDFNVPLDSDLNITDDTRIKAAIPTLKKVISEGGKLVVMSHLGRPKGEVKPEFSLSTVVDKLSELLETSVQFVEDCIGDVVASKVDSLDNGEVLLLENLRFYKEETEGDSAFAQKLASLADFYINDAFGTAHRRHASTAVVADFFKGNCCFGYLLQSEIENVNKVLNSSSKPVTAVVGGAKVSSKIDIIMNLINKVDNILIGGGMAYTFSMAKGGKIGNSLVEEDKLDLAMNILEKAEQKGVKVMIPEDSINASEFSNDANIQTSLISEVQEGYMGLDIGPKAIESFSAVLRGSKVILWNGPMGVFEMDNFSKGTAKIGLAMVEATEKGAFTLVGGGDSVAAAKQFGLASDLSYISTGGGAMLEYLEGKELPGIAAIIKNS